MQPNPPSVTFKGAGHGDLQIDLMYYANMDLLSAFNCDQIVSHKYVILSAFFNISFINTNYEVYVSSDIVGTSTNFFVQQLPTYRAVLSKITEEAN